MIFLLTRRDAAMIRRSRRVALAGALLLVQAMGAPAAPVQDRGQAKPSTAATDGLPSKRLFA